MPRKLLFIVNPNAGRRTPENIIRIIRREIPENIHYQVMVLQNKADFDAIAGILKSRDYSDAIAVGGDGTVNCVAQAILNTGITLGIVPIGSGNGLARSLGLSMQIETVIRQIIYGKTAKIDSGIMNGIPFFCTSGIGFDAHIGSLFAATVKRGLQSYIKITLRELFKYRAKTYTLSFGGKEIVRKAFLITVANAGQYGNDFYIAPQADMHDGLFHVVVLKPFNVLRVAGLLNRILARKAFLANSIETFTTDKIVIRTQGKDSVHFDGEPTTQDEIITFENKPASLKVIVGENYGVQIRGKPGET